MVHTELESFTSKDNRFDINTTGHIAYLYFGTAEEALNMREIYHLDGHEIRIWHRGRFLCTT